MAERRLRVVSADDPVLPHLTVGGAAKSGDRVALLVAMRDRIAQTIEDPKCPPRDLSSLSRRLMEIANELEGIAASGSESGIGVAASTADEGFDAEAL